MPYFFGVTIPKIGVNWQNKLHKYNISRFYRKTVKRKQNHSFLNSSEKVEFDYLFCNKNEYRVLTFYFNLFMKLYFCLVLVTSKKPVEGAFNN